MGSGQGGGFNVAFFNHPGAYAPHLVNKEGKFILLGAPGTSRKGRRTMEKTVSKSKFKPRALEHFREVEKTGKALIITDRGRPVLKVTPYRETAPVAGSVFRRLRGTLLTYRNPFEPVGLEDWEALK